MAMSEHDVSLVVAAQSGDSKSFEELYTRYSKKVFAVIRATVKNESDVEDILQQTFISAWQNFARLVEPSAFNKWIQKIAINLCYNLLRKKNITLLMDIDEEMDFIGEEIVGDMLPAVYAERDDLRERLGRIIDSLSEVQRQTIVMFYFNELKVEEIAQVMECNVGTVKSRLFLARKAIRAEIDDQERKSGEKFYGIPMLPLGELIVRQIEAITLSQSLPNLWASITESIGKNAPSQHFPYGVDAGAISGGNVAYPTYMGTSASGSIATGGAATGSTAGGVGLSVVTKVLICACALLVCTAGYFIVSSVIGSTPEYVLVSPKDESVSDETLQQSDYGMDVSVDVDIIEEISEKPEEYEQPYEPVQMTIDWQQMYLEELLAMQTYLRSGDFSSRWGLGMRGASGHVSSIMLADLNFDGVPELIIMGNPHQGGVFAGILTANEDGVDLLDLLLYQTVSTNSFRQIPGAWEDATWFTTRFQGDPFVFYFGLPPSVNQPVHPSIRLYRNINDNTLAYFIFPDAAVMSVGQGILLKSCESTIINDFVRSTFIAFLEREFVGLTPETDNRWLNGIEISAEEFLRFFDDVFVEYEEVEHHRAELYFSWFPSFSRINEGGCFTDLTEADLIAFLESYIPETYALG